MQINSDKTDETDVRGNNNTCTVFHNKHTTHLQQDTRPT